MSTATLLRPARAAEPLILHPRPAGPIGGLGRYTATHSRTVLIAWLVVAVVIGFFAPRIEEMGVVVGSAVLLDATLVRLLQLPVLLRLLGRRAWYLPRWAHRMLPAVTFAHAPGIVSCQS